MSLSLCLLGEGPKITGIDIPRRFYWVLKPPAAPLAGMPYPINSTPWANIWQAGFRHVVNLYESTPKYDPAPLSILYSAELRDLVDGGQPHDPQHEEDLIRKAVKDIAKKLSFGEGVVIHCWGGRGRTGTVIGCLLRTLGFTSADIISYLNELHIAREKSEGWPESSWQAQLVQRFLE